MANFLSGRKTKLDLGVTDVTESDITLDVTGIVTANQYNSSGGVDAVGLVTARTGIKVNTGEVLVGVAASISSVGDCDFVGIVTANQFKGNQVIGTPTIGNFRAGAYTPVNTEFTKDSIDELNYILGKLVPPTPNNVVGVSVSLDTSTLPAVSNAATTVRGLCAGFTPVNNTGDAAPTAGSEYYMNHDNTITTVYKTEYGPGDTGVFKAYVNNVGVGTTTLNVSFGLYDVGSNNGTYDSLVIANEKDAADATSGPTVGIASLFYEVFDFRVLDAPAPVGYNKVYFTHQTSSLATTGAAYWYEDSGPIGAPVVSFGSVELPDSPTLSYSSGIPHYTQANANAFRYTLNVENATGDMYYRATGSSTNKLLWAEGQTTWFNDDSTKLFNNFKVGGTQGTHPPQRNFGVGTAATCMASHTPRDIHSTCSSSNPFNGWDCWTPYGQHQNQHRSFSDSINIMGTTARTNEVDEDNIAISGTLGSGSGNATRVKAGSNVTNPSPTYVSWTGGSAGTVDTFEAIVRGADLRHDETNYSTGWAPAGPNLSGGSRSGNQYFQFEFIRSAVSEFNIVVTGTYGGCWVTMPDNSTWVNGLSNTNGWADMFQAAPGAGVPNNAGPGCSSGGAMDGTSGTYKCVFGTESSTNDTNNRILVRIKMDSGDAISALSIAAT